MTSTSSDDPMIEGANNADLAHAFQVVLRLVGSDDNDNDNDSVHGDHGRQDSAVATAAAAAAATTTSSWNDDGGVSDVYVLAMEDATEEAPFYFLEEDTGVVGFDGCQGFAVWLDEAMFDFSEDTSYWIFCQFTSGDARPLRLSTIQKDLMEPTFVSEIATGTTGSWDSADLQWFHYGPFKMGGKQDGIRIDTDGYWPHVKQFVIVPANHASTSSNTELAEKSTTTLSFSQPSHYGLQEQLASIPLRRQSGLSPDDNDINDHPAKCLEVLRQPKTMSPNVNIGSDMIVVDGPEGYYEFEFANEVWATEVYLDITYCSGDSRPIQLIINGSEAPNNECCAIPTGGYGSSDFSDVRCGPYSISNEVNTFRCTTNGKGYFPHLSQIRVVDATTMKSGKVTERSIGTWIVPPSRPLTPDLAAMLHGFCFMESTQEPNPNFCPDFEFYNGINLDGLWVLASKQVEERVLNTAAQLLSRYIPVELRRLCLQWRAPLDMPRGPFRVIILDHKTNQQAGDCPDFPDSWTGRNGTSNPGIFTSADDFCEDPSQDSPCGELTVHEVTHGLDMVIRQQLDPYFFQQCDESYRMAVHRRVFKKAYAAADRHEYLAEICTLFVGTNPKNFCQGCFECNKSAEANSSGYCDHAPHAAFPPGAEGVKFRRKSDLIKNDFSGYELLKSFLVEIKHQEDDSFWWES